MSLDDKDEFIADIPGFRLKMLITLIFLPMKRCGSGQINLVDFKTIKSLKQWII